MEFLLFFRQLCLNGQGVDLPAHHLAQRIVNKPVAGNSVLAAEGSGGNGEAVMTATGAGAGMADSICQALTLLRLTLRRRRRTN